MSDVSAMGEAWRHFASYENLRVCLKIQQDFYVIQIVFDKPWVASESLKTFAVGKELFKR